MSNVIFTILTVVFMAISLTFGCYISESPITEKQMYEKNELVCIFSFFISFFIACFFASMIDF